MEFIGYSQRYLLDQTKFSIRYWDTSVPSTQPWPASDVWETIDLNEIASANSLVIPEIGHASLRVWLMLGTPANPMDIPNIGITLRAPGQTWIVPGAWASQARDSREREPSAIEVPCSENKFEYAVTRNNCVGCSYGINIEWLGYWPKEET